MSKSAFSQLIKNEYREREREIKIKGDINLYGPITPTNLIPQFQGTFIDNQPVSEERQRQLTINNDIFTIYGTYTYNQAIYNSGTYPLSLPAGTYTIAIEPIVNVQPFTITFSDNVTYENFYASTSETPRTFTLENDFVARGGIRTSKLSSGIYTNEQYKITLVAGTSIGQTNNDSYGINDHFIIGDTGEVDILDYRVDETSDLYYERMPFSELNIDVDNLDGYFSDFTENSIVDKLNENCFIDLYLNVNDTGWIKAWTMQYDSLKADNQKAKLTFKPYCEKVIKQEQIYDKNKYFLLNTPIWDITYFNNYMLDNYQIGIEQDNDYSGSIIVNKQGTRTINNMLLEFGSAVASLEKGQILTIKDNNKLRYRVITSQYANEYLTNDEILEKPLLTKETLQGIVNQFNTIISYSVSSATFEKEIESVFRNNTETLVIYGESFDLSNIQSSSITLTNATLVSYATTLSGGAYGVGSHYLVLEIMGNIGDRYTININANLPYVENEDIHKEIYTKDEYVNTDNFIKLDVPDIINTKYWEQLVENLEKKIELKIKALPYLEVGDIISVDNEKFVITELHTTWSDGFKMNVIGYKIKY